MVLNRGPLDWESSILTTRLLLRKCQVCNFDHPTGLHGYIHKKKDGALTNYTEEKQGGSNLKINFAEMDLKSASATSLHLMSLACVLKQLK